MTRPAVLIAAGLVVALAAGLLAAPDAARDPHTDFVAYWAVGRLHLAGRNPYDPAAVLATQREVGWQAPYPMMVWSPPWALPVYAAFGAVPYPLARGAWLVGQLALTLGCGLALWRFYRGPPAFEWVAVVVVTLFVPLHASMGWGQIGPLGLLGLTGFLLTRARRRDFAAGAFLALASLKPHLVYAVWPAVAVWAVSAGRWRVLLGLAAAGLALALAPLARDPAVYARAWELAAHPPPSGENFKNIQLWDSPTFGWQLRLLFGMEYFKLQYLPTALGLGWLAWHGWRHRRAWDWAEQLPLLAAVSLATAAYGSWVADSVYMLPAVVAVAAAVANGGRREVIVPAAGLYVALMAATFAIERRPTTEAYVWVPPVYVAAFAGLRRVREGGKGIDPRG